MRQLMVLASLIAFGGACASTSARAPIDAGPLPDAEAWRAEQPKPGEPPELATPRFEKKVLDNGVTLIVSERRDLPLVAMNVVFATGSAADPTGKEGIAELTFETLLEGAGKRDALALDTAFADLGTSPFVSVGSDGSLVGTTVLTRNLDAAAGLLAEIVLQPRFEKASFERRQQQQLADLAMMVGNPRYLAGEAFAETIYGESHPYGRLGSGTPATVSKLQLADAKKFWSQHAGPKAAALVFAGDISMQEAEALAKRHFGKWKGNAKSVSAPAEPKSGARERVVFVPKKGLNQTMIMMGSPAIPVGHPDEFALELASTVFGGSFGSRLNMNLREAKGYTYGASAYVNPRLGVGPVVAASSVRADATGPALVEFFAELEGVKSRPITDEELEAAREGRIRSLPGSFESVGGIASAAANLFILRQPLDRYERMIEGLQNADKAAVQAAAEKYLDPSRMQIVLVGDPEVVQQQVQPLNLGEIEERNPVVPAAAR